jgi:predicted RNase H-like HicB family nuclease
VPEIPFRVVFEYDFEDGGYIATTPSLAGVVGQGRTKQEAARDLEEALEFTVDDMESSGEPLPEGDKFTDRDAATEDDEWTIRVAV